MAFASVKEWVIAAFAMVWAFLAPVHTLMAVTGALVVFDFITGIAKAFSAKEKITSNRMRHTITKFLAYQITVLTGFFLDQAMGLDLLASRVVTGAVCLVEAKSVLENVTVLTGVDVWSTLITKLRPPTTTNPVVQQLEQAVQPPAPPAPTTPPTTPPTA